jgi:uncharacterized protein YggT (Ycf19 family)
MQQPQNLAANLVNLFTGIVTIFLGLRFILKLFGANDANDFVGWVYDMSAVLLEPFRGIFPVEVIERQYVLEFSTLFAMVIYAILGMLLLALVVAVTPDTATTTKKKK